MNWISKLVFPILLFSAHINPQQIYTGNSALDCSSTNTNITTTLDVCNSNRHSCRAFLIFTAKSPYTTVAAIAALTSSDQSETTKINNVTRFTILAEDQEVVIPVNCSCSGQYYRAITTYQIAADSETYLTIANATFQGLSTCDALKHLNINQSEYHLQLGDELGVPLRCACPTREQVVSGTNFLLTYPIGMGDTLHQLSKQFNVSVEIIRKANGLLDESSTIYPFTTILIPLPGEPSWSHTVSRTHDKAKTKTPSSAPVVRKTKSNRVLSVVGIVAGALSLVTFLLLAFIFRGMFKKEVLAVKKSDRNVDNEVKMLQQINHFNIVKLCGFCEHKDDSYLVYEYMENGSLQEWLARRGFEGVNTWSQLIHIALDVANGLLYLHKFTNPAHVHNYISSSNILLDGNLSVLNLGP